MNIKLVLGVGFTMLASVAHAACPSPLQKAQSGLVRRGLRQAGGLSMTSKGSSAPAQHNERGAADLICAAGPRRRPVSERSLHVLAADNGGPIDRRSCQSPGRPAGFAGAKPDLSTATAAVHRSAASLGATLTPGHVRSNAPGMQRQGSPHISRPLSVAAC